MAPARAVHRRARGPVRMSWPAVAAEFKRPPRSRAPHARQGQLARGVVNERPPPRVVEVRKLLAYADQREVVVARAPGQLVDPAGGRLVFEQLPDLLEREVLPGRAPPGPEPVGCAPILFEVS